MGTDKAKVQIDLVEKVTKQIITLSSGIVTLLVTILGLYFHYLYDDAPILSIMWPTLVASCFFLLSIILGLLVYGSLIANTSIAKKLEDLNVYESHLTCMAISQWITFIIGIFFLIISLIVISTA